MAGRGVSWVWLLLAAGLLLFAALWLSQDPAAPEESSSPSLRDTGRRRAPPGGDFSSVRRDRPIEPRGPVQPSIAPGERLAPAAPASDERSAPR